MKLSPLKRVKYCTIKLKNYFWWEKVKRKNGCNYIRMNRPKLNTLLNNL